MRETITVAFGNALFSIVAMFAFASALQAGHITLSNDVQEGMTELSVFLTQDTVVSGFEDLDSYGDIVKGGGSITVNKTF